MIPISVLSPLEPGSLSLILLGSMRYLSRVEDYTPGLTGANCVDPALLWVSFCYSTIRKYPRFQSSLLGEAIDYSDYC